MIFEQHVPEGKLGEYVHSIVYYNEVDVEHDMDKYLPDGTTNLVINLCEPPRYIYDNTTLKKKTGMYRSLVLWNAHRVSYHKFR